MQRFENRLIKSKGNLTNFLILNELNLTVLNDRSPTFHRVSSGYKDVLYLMLCSSNLTDSVTDFKVFDEEMTSDHYPIMTTISLEKAIKNPNIPKSLDLKKANWDQFRDFLNNCPKVEYTGNLESMCYEISKNILNAADNAIPIKGQKVFRLRLPPDIIQLIRERRKTRRTF
jgi:hypothetical protein